MLMRAKLDIEAEVAALGDLSREELAAQWEKIYRCSPPKGVRRELLIRAAAWHLQAKRLGGFSTETRRMLRSAIDRVEKKIADRDSQANVIGGFYSTAARVPVIGLLGSNSSCSCTRPLAARRSAKPAIALACMSPTGQATPGAGLPKRWSSSVSIIWGRSETSTPARCLSRCWNMRRPPASISPQ
ncbi:MAG: DUF2924 domain-containing protein [Mesorhizobium sp.]|nr:DUF2924 domain-containing protein [Mesorhizobium sp. M1A.F.Ca.IN.020.04.1.1]RUW09805.1 DUF2924 domain-containing protein [Mesorhizobium sp. M1A.F.Ca.IN.020.03.1.1]RWG26012.1 MAG: DUF2924 domain-containing protein [Mesorhizobium sp.]RWH12782.1 MAG: DUF2924 domain-containing protein [Mesorhizobium sp.]RWH19432.1 MAG: DUF2924 domain-containing protein [Mesorhizobium sp.]